MNPDNKIAIQQLPENILLDIFSYLETRDLFITERVCRQWYRIVSDKSLWRHVNLFFFDPSDLPKMWKSLSAHFSSFLLTLKIRGSYFEESNLWKNASISDSMLKEIGGRCPNLWLLDLGYLNISFESIPTSIKSLSISGTRWQPRWMKNKQQVLPKLEVLNLSYMCSVDNVDLEDIANSTNLKTLSIICNTFDPQKVPGMELIAKNLQNLETLNLSHTHADDSTIYLITRHLKNLKELSLFKCRKISDSSLALIAVDLPKLNCLDISFIDSLTIKGLKSLFKSKLKILRIIRDVELTNNERNALMKGFPHSLRLITSY